MITHTYAVDHSRILEFELYQTKYLSFFFVIKKNLLLANPLHKESKNYHKADYHFQILIKKLI